MKDYSQLAAERLTEEAQLSESQKAALEELSTQLTRARQCFTEAKKLISEDVKSGELSESRAQVAIAQQKCILQETEVEVVEKMQAISPSYAARAKDAMKYASDLAAFETVNAATKAGEAVGAFLAPVVQAINGAKKAAAKGSHRRITDPRK